MNIEERKQLRQKVLDFLEANGIAYELYEHPEFSSVADGLGYWKDIHGDVTHCKNLFMRNHKGNRHYLISMECHKEFDIHGLEHKLREGKLSFASEERMVRCLGVYPGSVCAFGLINDINPSDADPKELFDNGHRVKYYLDRDILRSEKVSFHPCENTSSVVISKDDLLKFLSIWGGEVEWVEIKKPLLVIFDLDGTLLDTIEDLGNAVNHTLSLRGLPLHTLDEYRRMVGNGVRKLITKALPEEYRDNEGYIDSALIDFKPYYCSHIDDFTRPYPGMAELLHDLHLNGNLLAVASNKFQEGTEMLIERLFPGVPFVAILGNRPGAPLKPSPEIVETCVKAARAVTDETFDVVFVGDSGTDIATARAAGIPVHAVSWGFCAREQLAEAAPDTISDSAEELRRRLI